MLVTSALKNIALMGVYHRPFCRSWDTELSDRLFQFPGLPVHWADTLFFQQWWLAD
jgi:hypothetical protein